MKYTVKVVLHKMGGPGGKRDSTHYSPLKGATEAKVVQQQVETPRSLPRSRSTSSSSGGSDGEQVAITMPEEEDNRICRICYEGPDPNDHNNPLISPCKCSGYSKYVHRACLDHWRHSDHRSDAFYQCEVCKFKFLFRRLWWADILGSDITLWFLFAAMLLLLCFVLGFIPISNSFISVSGWALHFINGAFMISLIGLLGALFFVCAQNTFGFIIFPELAIDLPQLLLGMDLSGLFGVDMCGALAEGGVAILAILAAVVFIIGFLAACCYMYAILWFLTKRGLEHAQHMVENVADG